MRVLVTGFGPFGPLVVNPTQLVIDQLTERRALYSDCELTTEVLETEFRVSEDRIRRLIREVRPDACVCLGVGQSLDTIHIERVALNLDDCELPDNAGIRFRGRPVVPDGPPAFWSSLPIADIHAVLNSRGIEATISNFAGAYVCNHVFYSALHEIQQLGMHTRCGLIHVPLISKGGASTGIPRQPITLKKLVHAVELCLEILQGEHAAST
jgi:pyroglutamyl-peptidase